MKQMRSGRTCASFIAFIGVIAAWVECQDLEGMEPELQMEEDSEVGGRSQVTAMIAYDSL